MFESCERNNAVSDAHVGTAAQRGRCRQVGSLPDNRQTSLIFPGSDAQVHPADGRIAPPAVVGHVRSWRLTVDLFEHAGETSAHAVLAAQTATDLEAEGSAHRRPGDPDVPLIGDEIAVARALHRLADRLLDTAAHDIEVIEGHPVSLRS